MSMYTNKDIAAWQRWETSIKEAQGLRKFFKPVILSTRMGYKDYGYNVKCQSCGDIIHTEFRDNGAPLEEKFFPCKTNEPGHGHWGSVIKLNLN